MLRTLKILVMSRTVLLSSLLAGLALAPAANAALISGNTNSTGVGYLYFSLTSDSPFQIFSITTSWDPELWLGNDDGDLTVDDWFANNDDGLEFAGDAIINTVLTAGDYIAAIGPFNFTAEEATAGTVGESFSQSFQLDVTASNSEIIVRDGSMVNNVPTPATLALMGLGLAGLGWVRRRKV
ncbi:MAG: DVUA0089 family protein [Haliea sp.]|uniref:DVUA0089 family protein n=1 Tax=Haliea sp. TaxID=1932666 RepID=UPI0032EAC632